MLGYGLFDRLSLINIYPPFIGVILIKINDPTPEALIETIYPMDDPSCWSMPDPERCGYIQPQLLRELWFHTGTACNLSCPSCFEGSKPGDKRIEALTLKEAKPFILEAMSLGTQQFSFTGGEPFVAEETVDILHFALSLNPCLVLTNATEPLLNCLPQVASLRHKKHPLSFRVSLNYPDPQAHDQSRGPGRFKLSLEVMAALHSLGFKVSVARLRQVDEDTHGTDLAYRPFFKEAGLPENTHIVSFPELYHPKSNPKRPIITESCMTTYKSAEDRDAFMCSYSKMVAVQDGQARIYACTLVDDDADYNLGTSLSTAMKIRVMLRHHRCFSCFSAGTSCSDPNPAPT